MAERRTSLALVLVVLAAGSAAGCLDTGGDSDRGPGSLVETCLDPGRSPSGNAPWFDALETDPADLARRLAEAVDDPLAHPDPNPGRSTEDSLRWDTQGDGTVAYTLATEAGDRGLARISWQGPDRWRLTTLEAAEEQIREVLADIGVPGDLALEVGWNSPDQREEAWFTQKTEGELPGGTGGILTSYGYGDGLMIKGLHDLSKATTTYPRQQARAHAATYMRCALDEQGKTEEAGYEQTSIGYETLEIAQESLAYRFHLRYTEPPPPSHCGFARYVDVDAETGAVLAVRPPLCA